MVVTITRRKIEILVDAPLLRRVRQLSFEVGVTGYTLLPTLGGDGHQGRWLDDQVTGGAGSKVVFTTIVSDEPAERFLSALEPLLDEYGLMITCSHVEVMRAEEDSSE